MIKKLAILTSVFLVFLASQTIASENQTPSKSDKLIVCYVTNWAQYRKGNGKFLPENIDPFLCSHIVYSFAKLDDQSRIAAYEWNDESSDGFKGLYERTVALKETNPGLKVLIGVGGWNHGSAAFSKMVHDVSLRKTFVDSVVQFLQTRNFDGLDMDWEYPGSRVDSRQSDKQMFTVLLKELREAFEPFGYILSAGVSAGKSFIDQGYEISRIGNYLDFVNLMTYDYHGKWEKSLGHNSPLFSRSDEHGDSLQLNVDWSVNYWIENGLSQNKIVVGFPTYGRTYRLINPKSTQFGSKALRAGLAANYTEEPGFVSYYEMCDRLKSDWKYDWNEEHSAPYAFSSKEWAGFDDVDSFTVKAQYVVERRLAGAMIWALDLDDFTGTHCDQGKYPLVNAVKRVFENPQLFEKNVEIIPRLTTTTTTTTTTTRPTTAAFKFLRTTSTSTMSTTTSTTRRPITSTTTLPSTTTRTTTLVTTELTTTSRFPFLAVPFVDDKSQEEKESKIKSLLDASINNPLLLNDDTNSLDILVKKLKLQNDETLSRLKERVASKQSIFKLSYDNDNKNKLTSLSSRNIHRMLNNNVPKQAKYAYSVNRPLPNFIHKLQPLTSEITQMPVVPVTQTLSPQEIRAQQAALIEARIKKAYQNGFTDSYECKYDGLYADKSSGCVIFYECVWTNTRHANKARRVCPEGTIFNQNLNVCDWEFNTTC